MIRKSGISSWDLPGRGHDVTAMDVIPNGTLLSQLHMVLMDECAY